MYNESNIYILLLLVNIMDIKRGLILIEALRVRSGHENFASLEVRCGMHMLRLLAMDASLYPEGDEVFPHNDVGTSDELLDKLDTALFTVGM
jgi:hypothetical protein